jgi:hypothetical protein
MPDPNEEIKDCLAHFLKSVREGLPDYVCLLRTGALVVLRFTDHEHAIQELRNALRADNQIVADVRAICQPVIANSGTPQPNPSQANPLLQLLLSQGLALLLKALEKWLAK